MEKNLIKYLRCVFVGSLASVLLIAIAFETLLIEPGELAGDEVVNYWMSLLGVALILINLPAALKLMKFEKVRKEVTASVQAYQKWSILRLSILNAPLIYNVLAYYLLGCEPTFGYMALMATVAHLFVWPSHERMIYERELNYTQEEQ